MGAIGFTTLTFAINKHIFTEQFIICRSQIRPLILGQDFCVHHCTGCAWTPYSTKRFTVNQKLVLETEEPEADQYFRVKKSVNIPPRHYAVTHIQCRDLKEAVTLRPDEALKRTYPSMWADTYYVDPFKVGINVSTSSTTDPQVNQTQVETVPMSSGKATNPTNSRCGQVPPAEGAKVSSQSSKKSDIPDASTLSNKNPVTIPYVIFNLSSDAHIYIPKGTIVTHPDENEPEVDVIEIAETIEEAQETMQYRNHLPSRPRLPMPPKSDIICSPAEVKFHRRVELMDHNASEDTKSILRKSASSFLKCFQQTMKILAEPTSLPWT